MESLLTIHQNLAYLTVNIRDPTLKRKLDNVIFFGAYEDFRRLMSSNQSCLLNIRDENSMLYGHLYCNSFDEMRFQCY
jgi:hypothetical protein